MKDLLQQGNDTSKERVYQVVMPLDLGMEIPKDDSVRTLIRVTERMDYRSLYQTYERKEQADEATPKQMFQMALLGCMNGIYSGRGWKKACGYDIRFIWLLGGRKVPSHTRFANFIKKHLQGEVAEDLFYQFVKLLREEEEIAGENVFVDGTKIEANANRYSFVWSKSVGKNAEKNQAKQTKLLEEARNAYPFELSDATDIEAVLAKLQKMWEATGQEAVREKGKRRPKLQRHIDMLNETVQKQQSYEASRQILSSRNSYSKTDHDATFMRMKDDHMRKGPLKPAYNVQLGVEAGYIVGVDAVSDQNDLHCLIPLLAKMENKSGIKHRNVVADAGYESEENYTFLEQRGQLAYIKPQNYERSKTRSFRKNAYLRENMPYDKERDAFLCPAGKWLVHERDTVRESKSGFEEVISVYAAESCVGCPQKAKCTKAKERRVMSFSKRFDQQRQASRERIVSETGIIMRVNRSIQPEGTFGVLKENWGFRRFLRRGATNVLTELTLYAFAFNITKLHAKTMENRLRQQLFWCSSA